jgi:hypothetical protein
MQKKWAPTGLLLPVTLGFAFMFMSSSVITLALRPLRYLDVPVPSIFYAVPYVAPIIGILIWLAFSWRLPTLSAVPVLVLPSLMIMGVLKWAERQVDKVPVTRWINGNDLPPLEARLGFKVWEQGDADGMALWVARRAGYSAALADEVRRMETPATRRSGGE